jgi:hypothetical protein
MPVGKKRRSNILCRLNVFFDLQKGKRYNGPAGIRTRVRGSGGLCDIQLHYRPKAK